MRRVSTVEFVEEQDQKSVRVTWETEDEYHARIEAHRKYCLEKGINYRGNPCAEIDFIGKSVPVFEWPKKMQNAEPEGSDQPLRPMDKSTIPFMGTR